MQPLKTVVLMSSVAVKCDKYYILMFFLSWWDVGFYQTWGCKKTFNFMGKVQNLWSELVR